MAKHKDQTIKELKREIEALRAQLKTAPKKENSYEIVTSSFNKEKPTTLSSSTNKNRDEISTYNIDILLDDKYVKTQLSKTLILTAFSFAVIFSIYFYGIDKIIKQLGIGL